MKMNIPESRLKVEGFVKPLFKLMRACDVVLSKPGGLSTTEAFELKRPLVLVHPIQGVESHNAKYLTENEFALCPKTDEEVAQAVSELLNRPEKAKEMLTKREGLVPAGAAKNIAKRIIEETKKRKAL